MQLGRDRSAGAQVFQRHTQPTAGAHAGLDGVQQAATVHHGGLDAFADGLEPGQRAVGPGRGGEIEQVARGDQRLHEAVMKVAGQLLAVLLVEVEQGARGGFHVAAGGRFGAGGQGERDQVGDGPERTRRFRPHAGGRWP